MDNKKLNIEARCAIALCVIACVSLIVWCCGYFYNHLNDFAPKDEALNNWYNFASPIIAIANVLAFIGLTIAIYIGESSRQKTHEHVNIQNTIISKLQIVEKDLALKELALRKNNIDVQVLYTIYVALYRYENYFKDLPTLSILANRKAEKEEAEKVLRQIRDIADAFYEKYDGNKNNQQSLSIADVKPLIEKLNYLIAFIEEFEMSIIQDISSNVENPKS